MFSLKVRVVVYRAPRCVPPFSVLHLCTSINECAREHLEQGQRLVNGVFVISCSVCDIQWRIIAQFLVPFI